MTETTTRLVWRPQSPDEPECYVENLASLFGESTRSDLSGLGFPRDGVVVRKADEPQRLFLLHTGRLYSPTVAQEGDPRRCDNCEPIWEGPLDRSLLDGAFYITGYGRYTMGNIGPWPALFNLPPDDTEEAVRARIADLQAQIEAAEDQVEQEARAHIHAMNGVLNTVANAQGMCSTYESVLRAANRVGSSETLALESRDEYDGEQGGMQDEIPVTIEVPYTITLSGTARISVDLSISYTSADRRDAAIEAAMSAYIDSYPFDSDERREASESIESIDYDTDDATYEED